MYTLQNMARGYKTQLQLCDLVIDSGGWKLFENGREGDIKRGGEGIKCKRLDINGKGEGIDIKWNWRLIDSGGWKPL